MGSVNPYTLQKGCIACADGRWVIYNIGYPPGHDRHQILLCAPHYRLAVEAARNYELTLERTTPL